MNSKLDLTQEAVSLQVLNAAGGSIQRELKTKRPKGTIGPMEVEHTGPGNLPVKHILYSNLPKFTDGAYGLPEMVCNLNINLNAISHFFALNNLCISVSPFAIYLYSHHTCTVLLDSCYTALKIAIG